MNPIRARLIALAAGLLLARLASWGLMELTPEAAQELRRWLDGSLDLLLLAADAWLTRRGALARDGGCRAEARSSTPRPRDENRDGEGGAVVDSA